MKTNTLKIIGMAVSFIAGMGSAITAEAITWTGELGESVMARQIWNATCPKNTDQAYFRISNQVSAQGNVIAALGKGGVTVVETDDGTSKGGIVTQGPGIYTLVIFKDVEKEIKGIESFEAEMTCGKEGEADLSVDPIINLQILVK